MQRDPRIQVQRGYFRVRAAPRSRRGPAGAGSAASLPVARTTGCDGAISIRMIAAPGDIEAWGMQSASRFGVLGKPPKPGVYISPSENPPQDPPAPCRAQPSGPHVDRDMAPWHGALRGHGDRRMEQGAHRDKSQIPEEETRHSPRAGVQLPHPDASALLQTQGRGQGWAEGPWGPLHPAASHHPRQRGWERPEALEQQ